MDFLCADQRAHAHQFIKLEVQYLELFSVEVPIHYKSPQYDFIRGIYVMFRKMRQRYIDYAYCDRNGLRVLRLRGYRLE